MKRNFIFRISLVICFGFSGFMATAQQVNTLYFMENVPIRNNFNPAFQPTSNFYFGLPALGYNQFGLGNNSLTIKDLIYGKNGQTIYFLNQNGDKNKVYNVLRPTTSFQANLQLSLLDFGFRTGESYWTFGLSEKVDGQVGIPRDLMKLLLYGTPQLENNVYNFQNLGADVTAYTEAALGYSRKLNDKLTVGAKLKFLYGNFNASVSNKNLDLTASTDQWTLKGENVMNYSAPAELTGNSFQTLNMNMPNAITDWIKPSGLGAGIDLGVTFKPIQDLTLSAALLDLGMISWTRNVRNLTTKIDYTFDGLGSFNLDSKANSQTLADSVLTALTNSPSITQTTKNYTTYTSPKLNIGAEYAFLEDKLSLGLLSRTLKHNKSYFEELTASINGRPVEWFNASLSYSVLNGRMSNAGAGIGIKTGFVNWFLSADYVPFTYATLPISSPNATFDLPLGYNSKGLNLALGVNLVFGNRKDADHDGVIDRKDKCPETPFSVIVDKKGCPVDNDGDGVPDYLDKCPKTPKEAYNRIDQNGCPVDNDGDGVPDYLDKCPDTPKDAIGHVDSVGCTLDKDKDGVPDYKDKCPDTPAGMKVDTLGCPLDTDGDGVVDILDKCPNTPVEARGFVDKNGCPLDTDGDGVPDYKDKCPNTPVEARGFVDKNGCPLDSDGDGIPDYLHKSKVREVAPTKNHPEIKKEVKSLFQKALQGIQFETGKYVIMPVSYKILNQIAGVLIANPTYVVEIRGHTDNAGRHEANMLLSTKRAEAVMKYLVNKRVEANRMTAKGYGDTLPIVSNKTVTGKAVNRRVEFVVTFEEITFE
jgi:outer membrane protein OmpA-like peptidoglycan-associated protein